MFYLNLDFRSFGCLLINMLIGKMPYDNLDQYEVYNKLVNTEIPNYELATELSKGISEFISILLSIDSKLRPTALEAIKQCQILMPTNTVALLNDLNVQGSNDFYHFNELLL